MSKNNDWAKIVSELKQLGYTISTMESCTGGYIASCITNVSGSICKYADSNIGIGVTGNLSLNTDDGSSGGEVYTSIYNRETKQFSTKVINVKCTDRVKSKDIIANLIAKDLIKLLAIQGE